MNTFLEYSKLLAESLNSPYPYKWEVFDIETGIAHFNTDNGDTIHIDIDRIREKHLLEFTSDNSPDVFDMTNDHDGLRVFSTILQMITEYIGDFEDEMSMLQFSASKTQGDRSTNRARLYTRIIEKYLPSNWTVHSNDTSSSRIFQLIKS
jgi:hypothetical protein